MSLHYSAAAAGSAYLIAGLESFGGSKEWQSASGAAIHRQWPIIPYVPIHCSPLLFHSCRLFSTQIPMYHESTISPAHFLIVNTGYIQKSVVCFASGLQVSASFHSAETQTCNMAQQHFLPFHKSAGLLDTEAAKYYNTLPLANLYCSCCSHLSPHRKQAPQDPPPRHGGPHLSVSYRSRWGALMLLLALLSISRAVYTIYAYHLNAHQRKDLGVMWCTNRASLVFGAQHKGWQDLSFHVPEWPTSHKGRNFPAQGLLQYSFATQLGVLIVQIDRYKMASALKTGTWNSCLPPLACRVYETRCLVQTSTPIAGR